MPAGLGATADWLLQNQPFQVVNPFGPAGITDMTRQGWATGLEGIGAQFMPSAQYAQAMGGLQGMGMDAFLGGMQSGQFAMNPMMAQAAGMAGMAGQHPGYGMGANYMMAAGNQPLFGAGAQMMGMAPYHPGFGEGAQFTRMSPYHPGFGQAAAGAMGTMGQFGGGFSDELAQQVGRVGASFDPFTNPALGAAISEANERLARDFQQTVMPELNLAATSAGPGAYGGTRAGVAQGIREQALADAMQRQTTDMLSRGYEAGLGRYVQDRASTLDAVLQAMSQGGQLGMQGAGLLADIAGTQAGLGLGAGGQLADIAGMQAQLGLGAGQGLADIAAAQGQLGLGIGTGLADIGATQAGQQLQGAGILGDLGLGSLGQQNQMFQFGFGQMLPGMLEAAYQAQLQPGQVMQQLGGEMTGIGAMQQMQNQQIIDWMNSHAMQRQMWPWEQFQRYQQAIAPITAPSGSTVMQSGPGPDPWSQALQGGMMGVGLGQMWDQYFGGGGGYDPRLDPGPGTYY